MYIANDKQHLKLPVEAILCLNKFVRFTFAQTITSVKILVNSPRSGSEFHDFYPILGFVASIQNRTRVQHVLCSRGLLYTPRSFSSRSDSNRCHFVKASLEDIELIPTSPDPHPWILTTRQWILPRVGTVEIRSLALDGRRVRCGIRRTI